MRANGLVRQRRLLILAVLILCVLIVLVLVVLGLSGIGTTTARDSPEPIFASVMRVAPSSTATGLNFEDLGRIIIEDGSACGESDKSGEEDVVELAGSFTLPGYANAATVLIDGWQLRYLHGDENLGSISAFLADIELNGSELSWVARGHIADKDFEDGYEFCYYYTVLGWNDGLIDALADHGNENGNVRASFYDNDTTALGALSSYVENPEFASKKSVAILPRGFSLAWADESRFIPSCFECPVDRHLLQIGYNMDHGEAFVEQGKDYNLPPPAGSEDASSVVPALRSWESYSILKDNDAQNDYWFREYISALGGDDIDVIEPPFSILPKEDMDPWFTGCLGEPTTKTHTVEVRDVPFDYAVPMLTGWDLVYACDDEKVNEIGIWLTDVEYEKDPVDPTGILRYTVVSILRDDDTSPGHFPRHKVTILGLNGREPPDLVPHELKPRFCSKDPLGRLLVSVANNGIDEAPASTTRVVFSPGGPLEVMTPAIPAGFIATLEPIDIPPSCSSGDCSFTIMVDSSSKVTETNEMNNIADGGCIG